VCLDRSFSARVVQCLREVQRRFGIGERYGRRQVRGVVAAEASENVEPHAMTRSTALPKQVFGENTPSYGGR
jgi:hypothetical protein